MKKHKLLFFIFMLFGFCMIQTHAATVRNTCEYNYYDQLTGHASNSTVSFYTNNSTPRISIKSFNGHHIRNLEYRINNWNDVKDDFSGNMNCPQYVLIYHFVGRNNATTVEAYLANNRSYLEGKIKDWWSSDTYHIAISSSNPPSSATENYYQAVVNHTEHINSTYQNYSLNQCMDSSKVITRISKCNDIYDSLVTYMNNSEKEVNSWIRLGYISADDARTKAFFEALANARNRWSDVKKELDEEQRKIDEEMGIETDPNKGNSDDPSKNEGNEKNEGNSGTDIAVDSKNIGDLCASNNLKQPLKYIGWVLTAAKILVPILIIIMGAMDFFKVMTSTKGDEIPKAAKGFAMRIITGVVIFFIPALIHFVFTLIDDWGSYNTHYSECTKCLYDPRSC